MTSTNERYSPTFLATFLGCRQAAAWDLGRRRGEEDVDPDELDGQGALITRLGDEHEERILATLRLTSEVAVIDKPEPGDARAAAAAREATHRAMDAGVPWVHQGALSAGRWFGYADFLRRVETPCESWSWSYEPWDAKLSRHAKPGHVLQIGLYAELLDAIQGGAPRAMGLMLGTDAHDGSGAVHVPLAFSVEDFRYYVRRVASRLIGFAEALPGDFGGEPCRACGQCGWQGRCGALWQSLDHLSRVADISREQRRRLLDAGITTLGELADLAARAPKTWPPVALRAETLGRLVEQAALQRRTAYAALESAADTASEGVAGETSESATAPPAWALLPHRAGLGLDRLPPADPADLYFDFEGDPLEPGGLEYLCGVLARAGALDTLPGALGGDVRVPDHEDFRFLPFWAHDREGERRSFELLVDVLTDHLERHPDAHLYHYAPYERSALTRLAASHGTREHEVDELLRGGRLIDLYRVVREGVRVGAESYSIKKLEPLYMDARATDTADGGDSVVMYHAWRSSGERTLLEDIEAYNRDDCVSTLLLHEWLLARADELERVPESVEPHSDEEAEREAERLEAEREKAEARAAERAELEAEIARIEGELGVDDADGGTVLEGLDAASDGGESADAPGELGANGDATGDTDAREARERDARRLAADLLRFHQREDKPAWRAYFERREAAPETLVADTEAVGGCVADPDHWGEPVKRSKTYRFRFPPQDTKLASGQGVELQGGGRAGEIVELDARAGTLLLKRGATLGEPPERLSLVAGGPLSTDPISAAVRRTVRDFAADGDASGHVAALLRGDPPNIAGRTPGGPIVPADVAGDPAALLDATVEAVRGLERSWLCIQGPPGAGKTYTLARVIAALVADGKRVGVSSNSHAAIDNVLRGVERHVAESGARPISGLKKVSGGSPYESPLEEPMITTYRGRKGQALPEVDLYGGTAWWFAAEDGPTVDVLVVDEAGQVSLGHLVGMASAARSVVLVGDPMQLPQPTQGAHPRASGRSCLEHAIGDHPVIPPERGVFLGTSWRMHPALARFVSDSIYEGRLAAEPGCAAQRLVVPTGGATHPAIKPAGLAFVELDHDGCAQRSEPEAEEIARLYAALLATRVVDRTGTERAMTPDDILVVAPYNMQVNLLRERLAPLAGGAAPRVGTVDRFQGQEAEAVIVSMTTSDGESMPRDASFLLSRNRFNVAVSRARCLAVVVASSGLLDLDVRSVEEMRLANLLCRAREAASEPDAPPLAESPGPRGARAETTP